MKRGKRGVECDKEKKSGKEKRGNWFLGGF